MKWQITDEMIVAATKVAQMDCGFDPCEFDERDARRILRAALAVSPSAPALRIEKWRKAGVEGYRVTPQTVSSRVWDLPEKWRKEANGVPKDEGAWIEKAALNRCAKTLEAELASPENN